MSSVTESERMRIDERERERNCKIENGEKGSTKVRQSTHDVSKRKKKMLLVHVSAMCTHACD